MNMKTIFALTVIVALIGAAVIQAEAAQACGGKKFKTVHKKDSVQFDEDEKICNEAFGGDGNSCSDCDNKRMTLSYDSMHAKCGPRALTDCGYNPPCCLNTINDLGPEYNTCADP